MLYVKLVDLEPAWLSPDVLVFRSPSGHGDLITCKRVVMSRQDQYELIYEKNPEYVGKVVVMTGPFAVWSFEDNDFATLTVSPSVHHGASGNWHGFIRNGLLRF